MAYTPPTHWQPVRVAAAEEPVASDLLHPLREPKGSFTLSEPKRIGTSFTWKSWTKSFKSKADSEDDSHSTLPACNHGWKPYTMRKRILVPMAIWTAVLAAVIEFLAQKSSRDGGLSLSPKPDDISDLATFSYMFLPTIIAVILSIAWTWVDLDVKRIQPWLELSKDGGATVRDSLSLDYPYDFVAWVPFKAAKRRHWTVFVSGSVMVLIFWVITPLQGAIFGTGPVQLRQPASFYAPSDLMQIEDQSRAIDTSVLHRMYAVKYLGQTYPPFATAQYALRPFKLSSNSSAAANNLTATTTKFWTDLECGPAKVTPSRFPGDFNYDNGKGCNATAIFTISSNPENNYQMHYLAWYNSAHASQSIGMKTCPSEFSNQFLAIASKGTREDHQITALFCETSYWKQRVSIVVPDDTFHPTDSSVTPAGPVEVLPASEFNSTGFEYLLGSSVSAIQQNGVRDYPDNLIVDQYDRVNGTGLLFPLSPMVGFAIGGMERPIEDYLDASVMEDAYRAVHKSAFALTYSSLLTEATASSDTMEGSIEFVVHGILVSRVLSAVVEGLLLVVSACCLLLIVLGARMRSNLSTDPATLDDQMNVLQHSHDFLNDICRRMDVLKKDASTDLKTTRFHLQCACRDPDGIMSVMVTGLPAQASLSLEDSRASPGAQEVDCTPVRPLAFRKVSGLIFSVLLVASLSGLLVLRIQEQKLGGLERPSESFEVLQLLQNYIPTTIATMIEPYWVLVNRLLCVFQPFSDLQKGKKRSHARGAMRARYSSLPPQLTLWSAMKSGHIMLATVCVAALLGNVLAVGLGGLFNEESVQKTYAVDLQYPNSHQFALGKPYTSVSQGRSNDNFFRLKANLTLGTPMPPWLAPEYYFRPFTSPSASIQNSSEIFKGRTRGYGLDVFCDEMKPFGQVGFVDTLDLRPVKERYGIPESACVNFHNETSDFSQDGATAMEATVVLCDRLLVFWGRSAKDPETDRETRYFTCHSEFKTALFDVTVDRRGRVLSHNRAGDFDDNLGYERSRNDTDTLMQMTLFNVGIGSSTWHNDTHSYNWISDIIKAYVGDDLIDPAKPMPEPSEMLPVVKHIWKRSFAYLLATTDLVAFAPAADDEAPFVGTRTVTETRIFMSETAFLVSAVVFAIYIVVAVVLYAVSIRSFLPRMPTTIAAVLEFTVASRAVRDRSSGEKQDLRFGRYIGVDGRKHVGIEYSECVMPINSATPLHAATKDGGKARRRWFGARRAGSREQ